MVGADLGSCQAAKDAFNIPEMRGHVGACGHWNRTYEPLTPSLWNQNFVMDEPQDGRGVA